jgi:hypothetical protein
MCIIWTNKEVDNNVFIALVATSFGRYDHHQANAIKNLKKKLHITNF